MGASTHQVMARTPQNRSMQIQFNLGAEGLGNHGFPQIGCKNTKRTVSSAVTAIFLVSWVSLTTSVSASPVRIVSHAYRSNPVSVASSPVYPIVQQSLLRSPANTNRPTALQSTQRSSNQKFQFIFMQLRNRAESILLDFYVKVEKLVIFAYRVNHH
ncbi:unnamed protein product [Notodromas monacha]|uniref:Uncharacterized protein n=1 Tax=Notodromas monacha TaxID=399045 RepID=A0A7R9C085_9CRUS|nr:unnamed protein product [Notodromas monacha]CAG0923794.1 unnamed protein product [Notodromas monacha]